MSATEIAAPTRFHVGLHCSELERSVRFYRVLFGREPARRLDDYARFELDEPALVLALYPSPQEPGGALNHVGLRLPDSEALVAVQRRLEEHGIATQRQDGVECCYARQTKFWVTDPDKVLWEVYTLHEDIDHSGFDDPPTPEEIAPRRVWEHRITEPLPERIPHADGALDEIRLEGAFNAAVTREALGALVAEAFRALRPGGKIAVHGLVGDRPFPGTPQLPGMAALVQRVPVHTEPAQLLETAGFGGLYFEKLGDIHCFSVNGVELREMRLIGWKPGDEGPAATVVYKGPHAEVTDEAGIVYRRNVPVQVSQARAQLLRSGLAAEQFTFLEDAGASACCGAEMPAAPAASPRPAPAASPRPAPAAPREPVEVTGAQRDFYLEQGYLILRGLFTPEEIAAATRDAEAALLRPDLISTDNLRCRWADDVETGACRLDALDPIIDLAPACGALAEAPQLLAALAKLYGEPACLFKDKLIYKPPGAKGYGLHQDYIAWPSFPKSFLTVVIPLDPADAENGCIEVFTGYHRELMSPADGDYHELSPDQVDPARSVKLVLEPGDVAIFPGLTPHRSDANRSDRWRRQLYLSYNAESDGGPQREAHYAEFRAWLTGKYAEYGKTGVWFK